MYIASFMILVLTLYMYLSCVPIYMMVFLLQVYTYQSHSH